MRQNLPAFRPGKPRYGVPDPLPGAVPRSLELISQNEDSEISPVSIYIAIANAMHSAGDKEGALKLLKEYNVEGVNNAEIGTILSKEQETSQESLTYLTRALLNAETAMLQFSVGYANACLHLDRPAQALEFNRLLYQFIQGLKEPGKASYLDKSQVILLVLNVFACFQLGDRERTKEYLRQARQLALRFDAAPRLRLRAPQVHHPTTGCRRLRRFRPHRPGGCGSPAEGQRKRLPRPVGPVGGGLS